jgi:glycosyltransferase involved in cell wall biosynthesis
MRVLVLNYEFPPLGGGASPVSYEISKGLVDLGHSVDVVTMSFKGLPKEETVDGVRVYRVPSIRAKKETCQTHEMVSYVLSAIRFLRKHLRSNDYDICHCHFIIPTGLVALYAKKRFGLEYVITAHGSDVPGYNTDRFQFQHWFTRPLLKTVCSNAKQLCSPSNFLRGLMEEKIGDYGIRTIPNGIDLSCFRLDLSKPKTNIILSTGRLLRRKGFHTLINAVHDVELPFEVHIAGDGPYRQELGSLAEGSRTKIVLHGWLEKGSEELLNLYERASIYVLASEKENASIALLEGMASRCVVITTKVSGCPETVGDAGFLIDYDDAEGLRGILMRLAEDPGLVTELSDAAYRRLHSHYLWDSIIKQYLAVFQEGAIA